MNKQELNTALKMVEWFRSTSEDDGICYLVAKARYEITGKWPDRFTNPLFIELFRKWKYFSGSTAFPVPATRPNWFDRLRIKYGSWKYFGGAGDAFYYKNKWDPDTEYGQLRRELLDFMIKETE